MRAIIISNGDICNYDYYKGQIKKDDYIICADGAIRHCIKMNIIPDLWIGDFDSCNFEEYLKNYSFLKSVPTLSLNPEKDETDTHYSCNVAIEKGFNEITIWGGLGSRVDHSLANVSLLEMLLEKNIKAVLENENNRITVFKDFCKIKKDKKYLSLIPLDKNVTVINTTGLFYSLENYTMSRCLSLGISNEFTDEYATVTISGGAMLCIESDD